jgi:MFS transporter, ACS family, hexuronate transporter
LRTVVQTLPEERRGRGLAVAYSGGSLGAVVTPLIVTPVFLAWGWRGAFWFTGAVGIAWLALWAVVSRRPDIRKMRAARESSTPGPHVRDRRLWAFMCAYALGALPLGFVLYSASLYLAHPLGCTQKFIGQVLWIPPLGWEIGYFFWGWLADRRIALRPLLAACAVLNLAFFAVPFAASTALVLLLMFVATFVASGFVVLSIAYASRVYSADHAGLIAGVGAGSWSAMLALMMPYFGRLFDLHAYSTAFWIAATIPIFGFFGWLLLSRETS